MNVWFDYLGNDELLYLSDENIISNDDDKGKVFIFTDFNVRHDRVVVVEGEKFYVQAGYLSIWSDFFNTMFNGEFKEANEKEIVLGDLTTGQFTAFLKFIYPGEFNISKDNVIDLLVIADRFMAPFVMHSCQQFLNKNFDIMDKIDLLEYAFKFNLDSLKKKVGAFLRSDNVPSFYICPTHQNKAIYCCPKSIPQKGYHISGSSYVGKNRDRIAKLLPEIQSFIFQAIMSAATP